MNRRNFIKIASALTLANGLAERAIAQEPGRAAPPPGVPEAPIPVAVTDGVAFSEQWLFTQAENLARQPFAQPELNLPSELDGLDQQRYQAIQYKPDAAVWKADPFNFDLQFFHTGFQYEVPVEIHLIDGGVARPFLYSPSLFDFGAPLAAPPADSMAGFSGLRVHAPVHNADGMDSFLIFQGASYFRGLATGQTFGTYARAVSVNTAQSAGEEFPFFRSFWIQKPSVEDRQLLIYGLLDGPSLAGVYKFRAEPGRFTAVEVEATLFPRKTLTHVGIAPLTSMYFFGTSDHTRLDDYRPNVHNAGGLQIWTGAGEWIWRPLVNPERLQYSAFSDKTPKGFGLLQRKRAFHDFEDIDARFGDRPSLWVEPLGDWGEGTIDLIELPTRSEIYDNIVAFWRPKAPLGEIASHYFRYRLHWGWDPPVRSNKAYALQTRVGTLESADTRYFVVDFVSGGSCNNCNVPPFSANVTAGAGEIRNVAVRSNPATGGQRVTFEFRPGRVEQTDLRCELKQSGQTISEFWVYRWSV